MDSIANVLSYATIVKVVSSLVVLTVVFVSRTLLARAVSRRVSNRELRRRWLASIRNSLFILLVLALISIWADTIQTFAVSILAFAVALVIATKELLMCVLGSIVRVVGDSYSVGDRVEIGGHRGDVIDHNLLTTTLLEVGPEAPAQQHSGRVITLPNSVLLTGPVTKEASSLPYLIHTFVVPSRVDGQWQERRRLLLEAAVLECSPFLEQVRHHWKNLADMHDLTETSPAPHVAARLADADRIEFVLRIPAPVGRQAELQEAIVGRFLEALDPLESTPPRA
ncbi:MAG: mechanosensitive ion channel family protein [Gemmatimonadetes bacterium]|nr:mechanosensitive ion channel family protein [Gemmatimonadota bacterium]